MHSHSCPGSCRIVDLIGTIVGVGPDRFTCLPIEAVNAFHLFRFCEPVCNVYTSISDTRSAIPAPDRDAPSEWNLLSFKFVKNTRFVPNAFPVFTTPLVPFIGTYVFRLALLPLATNRAMSKHVSNFIIFPYNSSDQRTICR